MASIPKQLDEAARRKVDGARRLKAKPFVDDCKLAMVAAIEIYNKPQFSYREQGCAMLLVNAWDLALKALLLRNGENYSRAPAAGQSQSAFREQESASSAPQCRTLFKRSRALRARPPTLSWDKAFKKVHQKELWPKQISQPPVWYNLDLIAMYRDEAVHCRVDSKELGTVLYCLMQANVTNFTDLLRMSSLETDLDEELDWRVGPLRLSSPPVPIRFWKRDFLHIERHLKSRESKHFLATLQGAKDQVADTPGDLNRLLTHYDHLLPSADRHS